jgi:hypothetical protein
LAQPVRSDAARTFERFLGKEKRRLFLALDFLNKSDTIDFRNFGKGMVSDAGIAERRKNTGVPSVI